MTPVTAPSVSASMSFWASQMSPWLPRTAIPAAGIEVLGSQGDIWDAQKDMLADTLGAVAALVAYALVGRGPERKG